METVGALFKITIINLVAIARFSQSLNRHKLVHGNKRWKKTFLFLNSRAECVIIFFTVKISCWKLHNLDRGMNEKTVGVCSTLSIPD